MDVYILQYSRELNILWLIYTRRLTRDDGFIIIWIVITIRSEAIIVYYSGYINQLTSIRITIIIFFPYNRSAGNLSIFIETITRCGLMFFICITSGMKQNADNRSTINQVVEYLQAIFFKSNTTYL